MKSTNATARCCLRYLSKVQPAEKNVSNRIGEEKLAEGVRGSLGRYLLPRLRSRILSSPSSFKKTISIALPAMLRWACPALATPAEGRNPHFNENPMAAAYSCALGARPGLGTRRLLYHWGFVLLPITNIRSIASITLEVAVSGSGFR